MYRQRTPASAIEWVSAAFPVVLVTGPCRVGKAALLEDCGSGDRRTVSLDDLGQRDLARNDPALFLQAHPPPATIEEGQYAPQLFSHLKLEVDRARRPGMYSLTGSQKFQAIPHGSRWSVVEGLVRRLGEQG